MDSIGKDAPDFSLESTTAHNVNLSDLRGSFIVLIFYPANDTPVCNKQLDEANMSAAVFLQHNARVFGVNTAKVEKTRAYCIRRRLEFPILADPGGTVARKYGAFWGWLNMNRRTVVIIDPAGKIVFSCHGKPPPEKLIEAIDKHSAAQPA
jgi:peroxiredoxin Q/BCP